jgi:soluble lytic murein transglycosylase-like protein
MLWIFLSLLLHTPVVFASTPKKQTPVPALAANMTYEDDVKFLRGIFSSEKTYAPLLTLAEITQRRPNWWVWFPETLKALQKKAEKACASEDHTILSTQDVSHVRAFFRQHHPKTLNGWHLYKKIQKKNIWERAFVAYTHHCGFSGVKELYPLIKNGSLEPRPFIHALLLKGDQQSITQARELLTFVTTVCRKNHPRYSLLAQLVAKNTNGETSEAYEKFMASCTNTPWKNTMTLAAIGHYIRSNQGEKALKARRTIKQEALAHPKEIGSLDISIMGQLMQEGHEAAVACKSDLAQSLYKKAVSISIIPGEHAHEAYWRRGFIYATGLQQYAKAMTCFTHASTTFSPAVLDPKHIIKLRKPLKTPTMGITRHDVRALFWAGFAAQYLKKGALAKAYFTQASHYGTYFYGQMACWKLGKPIVLNFAKNTPGLRDWRGMGQREVSRIMAIWKTTAPNHKDKLPAYDTTLALCKDIMALAKTPGDNAMALQLIKILYPNHVVESAMNMAKHSNSVFRAKYPIIPLTAKDPALVHSIIAQESSFQTRALSWVGAIGVMQIMETSAKKAAKEMGIPLDMDRLHKDTSYQITLGSHIISAYINRFDGRYIPGIAAYNAGPNRAKPWLTDTPKWSQPEDALMWIESIPLKETRNYVLWVLEGYIIYRILMNNPIKGNEWSQLLRAHW